MSDTADAADIPEEAGEGADSGGRKLSGKVLVLYIILPLLLLSGLGVGGLMMFGGGEETASSAEQEEEKQAIFFELPDMLVNLSQNDKRAKFLKIKVALETSDKAVSDALQLVMPRIVDTFQVYLRELRTDDLEGSAGVYRLKEELLRRVNLSIRPRKIDRVLFKEIIIQ